MTRRLDPTDPDFPRRNAVVNALAEIGMFAERAVTLSHDLAVKGETELGEAVAGLADKAFDLLAAHSGPAPEATDG